MLDSRPLSPKRAAGKALICLKSRVVVDGHDDLSDRLKDHVDIPR
ncbi:MAG TPA: hypothetical protein VMU82_16810 [Acetobacteraceae bacterium]|nr:hypothetical protein [Acetobacteraceae bacterium]